MTSFWITVSLLLSVAYLIIILRYLKGWQKLPEWDLPPGYIPKTSISVIIPARNEEKYIHKCILSVLDQNYPAFLFEILVIDDHSTDQTTSIVNEISDKRVRLIKLVDFLQKDTIAFKKKAIETGIQQARGDLIVTTDADCEILPNWLPLLASCYEQKQAVFIAAPVNFHKEKNSLEHFQSLDFLGMMLITGAGIQCKSMHLCNGANLAYSKVIFQEVGGFSGIDHLASGDDMLLLQKISARFPDRIAFLKNPAATVHTRAQKNWSDFITQRVRWASKSNLYPEWQITFTLAMVFFFCSNIFFSLLLVPFLGTMAFLAFSVQLLLKIVLDFFLLKKATRFFQRKEMMRYFLLSQFYHLVYIVAIGTLANLSKNYHWKGRKVK